MMTRRDLVASLAAVAGAMAARHVPAAPALTEREALFLSAHKRAVEMLLEATDTGDYSAWETGQPARADLAFWQLRLSSLADSSPLETTLAAEMRDLWFRLTRPDWRYGEAGFQT